jgi:hypothetical protein
MAVVCYECGNVESSIGAFERGWRYREMENGRIVVVCPDTNTPPPQYRLRSDGDE